ncbi:isochorismatase [Cupriavidus campinensis]
MQSIPSPYTVAVYPIEQQPGVWFAAYLISEYKDGMERVVANVAMRHDTHRTAAKAKHAARCAGEGAIARLAARHYNTGATAQTTQGARHG